MQINVHLLHPLLIAAIGLCRAAGHRKPLCRGNTAPTHTHRHNRCRSIPNLQVPRVRAVNHSCKTCFGDTDGDIVFRHGDDFAVFDFGGFAGFHLAIAPHQTIADHGFGLAAAFGRAGYFQ